MSVQLRCTLFFTFPQLLSFALTHSPLHSSSSATRSCRTSGGTGVSSASFSPISLLALHEAPSLTKQHVLRPDVHFHCDVESDPFLYMEDHGKVYGFTITMYEYFATIPTLWDTVKGESSVAREVFLTFEIGLTADLFYSVHRALPRIRG